MPKPKAQQKYDGPTVKALYPYDAQDTDELAFQVLSSAENILEKWIRILYYVVI
jgi:hypothetical protein